MFVWVIFAARLWQKALCFILNKKNNLLVEIDSAGTASYHIGETPDNRTIANAKKNGVDLSQLRARQFHINDFDNFDKIYVMDQNNLNNVIALTKDQKQKDKVCLFLNTVYPGKNMEVPDPYYGTEQSFEDVFQLVYKACETFSKQFSV